MTAIFVLVHLLGCGGGSATNRGPVASAAVPVRVVVVSAVPLERTLSATGTVEAVDSAELRPEQAGLVEAVLFADGQAVHKGDALVTLRGEDAAAARLDAQARAKLASLDLVRQQALFERADVAQAELDRAVAADSLARAAVLRADEGVRRTTIRAPFDGVVGRKGVSVGEFVDPSRVITRVEGLGNLVVDITLPEAALATVATNQRALVTTDAMDSAAIPATVRYVAPRLREDTRTVDVRVGIDVADPRLRPGMTAGVLIVTASVPTAVLVPSAAVVRSGAGNAVYVVTADASVAIHPVQTGERRDDLVEVLEGVALGDTLVVEGLARLRPGAKVEIQP